MNYAIGPRLKEPKNRFRKQVSLLKEDRMLHDDMLKATLFLKDA